MKKIAVVTSTRAEFGLLMPVIQFLREYENSELKIEVAVTYYFSEAPLSLRCDVFVQ